MSEGKGGADYGSLDFTVRRFQLLQLAEWALPAVPSSPTLPVNGCFQVSVSPGRLRVAATDQQAAVFAEAPAVITQSTGEAFLPARKLKAILAEAREGDVTVSVKGNAALVTAGSAAWSLRLPPPDGYSGLPDLSGAQFAPVGREVLLGALGTVRHAVGKDVGRPAFAQVRIAPSDAGVFACAADSSQFSRAPVPGFPGEMLIPGAALGDLVKLLDKVPVDDAEVAAAGPYAVFRVGPVTLAALRMAKGFPDVDNDFLRRVQGNDMELRVDREALTAALRRVRINSDASTSAVALIADSEGGRRGRLTVTSRDKDSNSAEEVIPASWEHGQHLQVVNAGFLAAMLAVYPSAECTFRLGKDRGKVRAPLVLEDGAKGVTGICTQMVPALMGY
jgi:DNA polymerase III sliding clamp (beta) subunit (PCNA family)